MRSTASKASRNPIDAGRLRRDCRRRTKVLESGSADASPSFAAAVVPPRTRESLAEEATLPRPTIDRYTPKACSDASGPEHLDQAFRTLL